VRSRPTTSQFIRNDRYALNLPWARRSVAVRVFLPCSARGAGPARSRPATSATSNGAPPCAVTSVSLPRAGRAPLNRDSAGIGLLEVALQEHPHRPPCSALSASGEPAARPKRRRLGVRPATPGILTTKPLQEL
jgi:hypothetical protein